MNVDGGDMESTASCDLEDFVVNVHAIFLVLNNTREFLFIFYVLGIAGKTQDRN